MNPRGYCTWRTAMTVAYAASQVSGRRYSVRGRRTWNSLGFWRWYVVEVDL